VNLRIRVLRFLWLNPIISFRKFNVLVLKSGPTSLLDAAIDRNPEKPSAKSRTLVKPRQIAQNEGENFLDGIGRFFLVEKNATANGENFVVVPSIELLKSRLVTRQETIDEKNVLIE
jgi:hypothetical protein